jgi:hypothetical protein
VLDGASVTEVARRFGVSRQSVHFWLTWYAADGGLGGLDDRSSRPHCCPHQISPATEVSRLWQRSPDGHRRTAGPPLVSQPPFVTMHSQVTFKHSTAPIIAHHPALDSLVIRRSGCVR